MSVLSIENLSVHFAAFAAVSGVSLEADEGSMLTLLGPSGCGKSTILRVVAGLETPSAGVLRIAGNAVVDVARGIAMPAERRQLGMVFQSYAIWPHMTVAENVGYPLKVRGRTAAEIRSRVDEMLDLVGLRDRAAHPATDLSGGQQQRIAIARALSFEPKLLLLDEPLSNLDVKLRQDMGAEIKRIQRRSGVTAIYVTHDQGEALALSDRIVVLDQGRVQQIGTPEQIYERPDNLFTAWFVGGTNLLEATLRERTGEGRARVEIAGCVTPVDARLADGDVQAGKPIVLSIRPEDIVTEFSGEPDAVATVQGGEYLGDRRRYLIEVDGQSLTCYARRDQAYAPGSAIGIRLRTDAAAVFAKAPLPGKG